VLNGLNLGFEHCCDDEDLSDALQARLRGDERDLPAIFPARPPPARTCVGVTGLAYDALIEIDLICKRP